jgi:hypothetical protein
MRTTRSGIRTAVEAEVDIREVERVKTRTGTTRFVVRDESGREYTTFRERIGEEAERCRGRRARIEFHEQERNGFQNVYLDKVTPTNEPEASGGGSDPDEAAWRTAVEAAPWLLGSREPKKEVPPEELYQRLEPFKELVAEDIRGDEPGDDDDA